MTPHRQSILDQLVELSEINAHPPDLIHTALLLAAIDQPPFSLDPFQRHFLSLVNEVKEFAGDADSLNAPLDLRRMALSEVITRRHGYNCARFAFDDPDGCDLTKVIRTRSGHPVMLTLLYLAVLRKIGWHADIIDLKPHLFIRLENSRGRLIIDAAHSGQVMDISALRAFIKSTAGLDQEIKWQQFQGLTDGGLLIRLQQTRSACWLERGNLEQASQPLIAALLVFPETAMLWRECGLLQVRLGQTAGAIQSLERWRQLDDDPGHDPDTLKTLHQLKLSSAPGTPT